MLVGLRNLIPCHAKLMLYKTSTLPYLTYCHSVWKIYKSPDRRKLERIQKRALRAVYKSQTEPYEELLTRAKLPTLYNRRLQDIAILMYKIKYRMAPRCVPYLTYCHSVWKIYKSPDNRKLERIQKRALRAVYKSQTEPYEELLTRAKLPTLYNRRLQDIAILMYKIKYRMAPRCVSELFTIKSRHQSLRNCELPRFDIVDYGRYSLRYSEQRTFHLVKDQ